MSAIGAIIGLLLAIVLIMRKLSPVYSLLLGALAGGLLGGLSLESTVSVMIGGVADIVPAVVRILAAGVLSGILICTGAAESISYTIVDRLGEKHVYLAIGLSVMLLAAIGVFVDVAVITIAPVAMLVGQRLKIPKAKLLLVMIGGGKCGNIISPNPNTIVAAENFHVPLSSVMFANYIPAAVGLLFTVYVVVRLFPGGKDSSPSACPDGSIDAGRLPSFASSMVAPAVTVVLLALRPVFGIVIDPMVALPLGGLAGMLAMNKWKKLGESLAYGLDKMSVVAVLLIGTGAVAGVIKSSAMTEWIVDLLGHCKVADVLLAPASGALMSAATASTTAGATIASSSFSETILSLGMDAVWGAAMINAGSTVLDHLPHGSFFHASGGSMELSIKERMKLVPYESLVGFVLAAGSLASCLIVRLISL